MGVSDSLDSNDIDHEYHYHDRQDKDVPNFQPRSKSVPLHSKAKAPTLVALLESINERKETGPKWQSERSRKLAAKEFTNLTSENDRLYKELSALKLKYDDLWDHKRSVEQQLTSYKNKAEDTTQIMDNIDILKSKCSKLEMEKIYLMERLDSQTSPSQKPSINDIAEHSEQMMMEYTVKMQRKQNKINQLLDESNAKEKE